MLPRLLLALVERQETLRPTLCRLGSDMKHGAEGPDPCVLLPKLFAEAQRDLGLVGVHSVGEREGVPRLGGTSELAN